MLKSKFNIKRLIQDFQRRGVIKVITMYAATAFIILQLVDILGPALSLPSWFVTVVIALLALGFPVTVVISWIFDLTPKGFIKTESLEQHEIQEASETKSRRRLKVSDGVIIVLIVIICVLVYPKIFNRDKLSAVRDLDGKISVTVLPFSNITGDTTYNIWSGGFQNLLINTLSNSKDLEVRRYQAVNNVVNNEKNISMASFAPNFASEVADILETRTIVLGDILKVGDRIRINAKLMNSENQEIFQTFQIDGNSEDDLFSMADSLSYLLKNYIEIKKIIEEENAPENRGIAPTNSSEAFKYYIHGWNSFMELDAENAANWFYRSLNVDSTFISPYVMLSYALRQMGRDADSKYWFEKIGDKIEKAPLEQKLIVEQLDAFFNKTPEDEIKILQQLIDLDDLNPLYRHLLGVAHYRIFEYEEALESWEVAVEIPEKWGTYFNNPYVYFMMGNAYHQVGEHDKEDKILKQGLEYIPENFLILEAQAICALSEGDITTGNRILEEYKLIRDSSVYCTDAMISTDIGYIYTQTKMLDKAEEYYRNAINFEPENLNLKNNLAWFLINNDINVDEGIEIVNELLEANPENPAYLDTKGWGLYKKGDIDGALSLVKKAWENKSIYNHEIFLHLQELESVAI